MNAQQQITMTIGVKTLPMLTVPYKISTIDKCHNSETLTLINSPSVKPDMKFNVKSYGNQSTE
jgi:hypothetical protein